MSKELIRDKVAKLVKKFDTTDPVKLCMCLDIQCEFHDLGKDTMGFRTEICRISYIALNSRNSNEDNFITICHELGHHVCGHSTNTEFLKHSNLIYVRQGVEYEANTFMVELLTYGVNAAEYMSEEQLLRDCNVPKWAERYVDWDYIRSKAHFSSFDSIY